MHREIPTQSITVHSDPATALDATLATVDALNGVILWRGPTGARFELSRVRFFRGWRRISLPLWFLGTPYARYEGEIAVLELGPGLTRIHVAGLKPKRSSLLLVVALITTWALFVMQGEMQRAESWLFLVVPLGTLLLILLWDLVYRVPDALAERFLEVVRPACNELTLRRHMPRLF